MVTVTYVSTVVGVEVGIRQSRRSHLRIYTGRWVGGDMVVTTETFPYVP